MPIKPHGLARYNLEWTATIDPSGTPQAAIDQLNEALTRIISVTGGREQGMVVSVRCDGATVGLRAMIGIRFFSRLQRLDPRFLRTTSVLLDDPPAWMLGDHQRAVASLQPNPADYQRARAQIDQAHAAPQPEPPHAIKPRPTELPKDPNEPPPSEADAPYVPPPQEARPAKRPRGRPRKYPLPPAAMPKPPDLDDPFVAPRGKP